MPMSEVNVSWTKFLLIPRNPWLPLREHRKISLITIIDSNWPQATSAAKKFIGMKTKVLVADSIEELAKKMGADPKAFVSLVNEFNTALKGGKLKEMDPRAPCRK